MLASENRRKLSEAPRIEEDVSDGWAALDEGDGLNCPRCGSTLVHAEKRGRNLLSGAVGMSGIALTCLKCGHQFRIGDTRESWVEGPLMVAVAFVIVIAVLIVFMFSMSFTK